MRDNFSAQAAMYAKHRPNYPQGLFEFITGHVPQKELAWDCGTGNGQAAFALSSYFKNVYATDISKTQIENAATAINIQYRVEPAEQTALHDNSVNLVSISQALHWFDFYRFYEEVKRVSRPGGVIAAWTYSLMKTDAATDKIIRDYHYGMLGPYWDKARAHVDNAYETIPFPFKTIPAPAFEINVQWNLQQLAGYLNTWSALQKFIATNNYNPVTDIIERIGQHWPSNEVRAISFPIHLKMGHVF